MAGMSISIKGSEIQERIERSIQKKGATLPCPRCGNREFMPVNGYLSMTPAANPEMTKMSGYSIPLVAMECKNCGYFSLHDLRVLEG